MASKLDLEIIIVSYNSQFWLKKTLESLNNNYLSATKHRVAVTIVDNNSSDGSVEMIENHFKWATVLKQDTNLGFSAANNIALKNSSAEAVMLLNSDTELTKDSNLDTLLHHLQQHPSVGVITPRVELGDGSLDPACHRGEPTPWASFCYFVGLEKLFPKTKLFGQYHQYYKNLREPHQIDACSGAAMLVRQDAIEKVGFLDEQFFMYAEDLDWCKRFRDAGYQVLFYPHVSLIHHKNKSGMGSNNAAVSKKTASYFYDTMLQYYDKHHGHRYPGFVRNLIQSIITVKKEL